MCSCVGRARCCTTLTTCRFNAMRVGRIGGARYLRASLFFCSPNILSFPYALAAGDEFLGAKLICKRFEFRKCHHHQPVAASECLKSLLGKLDTTLFRLPHSRILTLCGRRAQHAPLHPGHPRPHPESRGRPCARSARAVHLPPYLGAGKAFCHVAQDCRRGVVPI